jgi:hypothetical protein
MYKQLVFLAASSFVVLATYGASAQGNFPAFTIADQAGNCLSLKAPDQSDGGGLTVKPCQNFPDFYVTVAGSITSAPPSIMGSGVQLQFRLNSMRFVCIVATDSPAVNPSGALAPVSTRNCSSDPPHQMIWNVRGPDNGLQKIEKMNATLDFTNFCMRENAQNSTVELQGCLEGDPAANWKLKPIP